MKYGSSPSYFHPYPSWGWYDSNAYSSSYFRPHNIEYSSHFNSDFEKRSYDKDRFIYKNRSRAQNKNRMVKQVYVVNKDNRKAKSSDLNSCITEPEEVLDTSASSTQTIEKLASDSPGTKSKLKKPNVHKQPRSTLGLSIWHKRLEKLSAQELKTRCMTWAPNTSSQDPGKDDAFGRSEVKANKRKKASTRRLGERFALAQQSYWSLHHPYFSVVPYMSSQGMFGYPLWHHFAPYVSLYYGGVQPNYYAYG
jgi:hypothetical protein